MKKLYVNCPVKYRKQEDIIKSIEKMHKIAEIELDQKLELILPPLELPSGEKDDLIYLSECINKIKDADFCVTGNLRGDRIWPGHWLINSACRQFNIPTVWLELERLMSDIDELIHRDEERY